MLQILMVLREHRPQVILMTRDPVDSFISHKKLWETKNAQDVDTSGLQITFNRAEYYVYKSELAAYFRCIQDYCFEEQIEVTVTSYEALHDDSQTHTHQQHKIEKVRLILEKIFQSPVVERAGSGQLKLFSRQDQSESAADKVVNPEQLPRLAQHLLDESPIVQG